jgi:hypothetical protein
VFDLHSAGDFAPIFLDSVAMCSPSSVSCANKSSLPALLASIWKIRSLHQIYDRFFLRSVFASAQTEPDADKGRLVAGTLTWHPAPPTATSLGFP